MLTLAISIAVPAKFMCGQKIQTGSYEQVWAKQNRAFWQDTCTLVLEFYLLHKAAL